VWSPAGFALCECRRCQTKNEGAYERQRTDVDLSHIADSIARMNRNASAIVDSAL
jgi:hypothetical protein